MGHTFRFDDRRARPIDVTLAGEIHRERHGAQVVRNALRRFDVAIGDHHAPATRDHEAARAALGLRPYVFRQPVVPEPQHNQTLVVGEAEQPSNGRAEFSRASCELFDVSERHCKCPDLQLREWGTPFSRPDGRNVWW